MGSVIVIIVVLAIAALIVAGIVKGRKKGKPSCGCGGSCDSCAGCALNGSCREKK
ncbi:MAG: FeoB-associated Cys-rich membrane protein [Clostridia bacterium]|nr:FeoB-associated Cys-rich membrane protein [Clostridia bacterium]